MTNKISENEIDLIELILILKKNFLKVILICLLTISIGLIYVFNKKIEKLTYIAETRIAPLSAFDESEYKLYNNYILENYFLNFDKLNNKIKNEFIENDQKNKRLIEINKSLNTSDLIDTNNTFDLIHKELLIKLFVDKIKENEIFIKGLKKFEFVKRESFENNQLYENAIRKLAASIEIYQIDEEKETNQWRIRFNTSNKSKWEAFLLFVEKNANYEINKYFEESFQKFILNEKKSKIYKIEDIESEILTTANSDKIQKLERKIQLIKNDKKLDRLVDHFNTTPIMSSDNFQAANLIIHSTNYEKLNRNETSKRKIILIFAITGLIIAIFYVLIENFIKIRALKD